MDRAASPRVKTQGELGGAADARASGSAGQPGGDSLGLSSGGAHRDPGTQLLRTILLTDEDTGFRWKCSGDSEASPWFPVPAGDRLRGDMKGNPVASA